MRRKCFTFLSALSLLLFVATGVAWLDNLWHSSYFIENDGNYMHSVWSHNGYLEFFHSPSRPIPQPPGFYRFTYEAAYRKSPQSLAYFSFEWKANYGELTVTAPHWFVAVLTGILPTIWIILWRKRRKLGPDTCRTCGYDLRASTDTCPECGTAIKMTEKLETK